MEMQDAITVMSALSQPTRYRCFRLLAGKRQLSAGEIGEALDIPPSLLSSHLSILSAAGLVTSQRSGRSIVYSANRSRLPELVGHLAALGATTDSDEG